MPGDEHEHRYVILVGNAPVTMIPGKSLPLRRMCACGDVTVDGYYVYDPQEG